MRVFLDTNVVVSGFTTRGLCADIVREVLSKHTLIISEQVLLETEDVLSNRFGVSPAVVADILELLRRQECAVLPAIFPKIEVRDQDDLAIIVAALESEADFLVSGDKDITSIAPLDGVCIATPREFWNAISNIGNV